VSKLSLTFVSVALGLALSAPAVAEKPGPRTAEAGLLRQVTPSTRRVDCVRTASPPGGFVCELIGAPGSRLEVLVEPAGSGYRTLWYPVEG
jgi:hypothetical protein